MIQSMADTGSVVPGSAEFMFTVLQGRGLGCGHFPRYSTKDTKQPDVQFPSRLGFFQHTESETRISILDTEKLCLSCLRQVVPNGYNFWSVLSSGQGDDLGSTHSQAPSLLGNYPPFVQAGTEKFPEPVILPIPDVPHAKDAWEWLKNEQKPFFFDHLHLTKRLTVSVKRAAERDFHIASAHGISFYQRELPGRSGRKNKVGSSTGRRAVRRGPSSSRTPDPVLQTTGEDSPSSLHDIVTPPQAADTAKSSSNVNGTNANVSTGSRSRSKKKAPPRVKGSRTSSMKSIQSNTASIEKTVQRLETKTEPAPTPPSDMCSPSTGNMPRLGEDVLHDSPIYNFTSFGESTGKRSSPHPKVDDKSTPTVGFNSVTLAAEILSKKSKSAPTTGASLRTKNWSRHTLTGFETPASSPKIDHEAPKGRSVSTKEQKTGRSKNPKKTDMVKKPKSREQKDSESRQSVKQSTENSSVANTRSARVSSNPIENGLPPQKKPGHQPKSTRRFPEPIESRVMGHKSKQPKEIIPLSNTRRHVQKNASDSRFRLGRDPSGHYPRAKHSHNNHFGKMNGRGIGHNSHNSHAGRNHTSGRFLQKPDGQPPSVSHIHVHQVGSQESSDPSHASSFPQPDIRVVNTDYMDSPFITPLDQKSDEEESSSSADSSAPDHHNLDVPSDSDSGSESKPDSDDTSSEKASDSDRDTDEVNTENSSSDGDEAATDSGKSESDGHSTDPETDREDSEVSSDDDQHSQSASSQSDDQTSDQDDESSSGDDDQNSDIETQSESSDQGNESSDRSLSEMDDRSYGTSGDDESDRHSFSDRYDSDGSS
ncbi:xurface protein [Fusarium flagelliforme]|uniref:Xurface protein n=2 Tax=Fusarium flagelliforme TaxID=2675880 RepID=A0A395MC02_9HYPO|nr:xurface protein [Fusarium flagelliforme]